MKKGESILITGGAGFVGSNLAVSFRRQFPGTEVLAFDNLSRRGSEMGLDRLRQAGVEFIHGDVRSTDDFSELPQFHWLIDCSAEPSVHAGSDHSPVKVLNINLLGTINCLEAARRADAKFLFLSTSRVYPIGQLNEIPFVEEDHRFRWTGGHEEVGVSHLGVNESFPLEGARSFYGASKLSSELIIREYCHSYGMSALVNRCGLIAGPWQMGKVDQGVVTLWVARHSFGRPLTYIGFGGTGKQVRDVLHVDDLFQLIVRQMADTSHWNGQVYNVGGGPQSSISLKELTELCQEVTKRKINIVGDANTHPLDVRIFITDNSRVTEDFGWQPESSVASVVEDTYSWISKFESELAPILA